MRAEKVCVVEEAWDGGCGRDWDEWGVGTEQDSMGMCLTSRAYAGLLGPNL